jgi:Ca-activated chloride channel homolog
MKRICQIAPITLFASTAAIAARAEEPHRTAPIELVGDGGIALPMLSSDAAVTITGDIATVRVTQTFANPNDRPLHARYVFPLPHDAAVYAMTMQTNDELVRAKIERVDEAKKTFETAKEQGKTAALLEEHRANVFTQDVANIPANDRVTIALEYAETIPREDGLYAFHFPMAVGTRYDNGANGIAVPALEKPLPHGASGPTEGERGSSAGRTRRVSVRIDLHAGLPIETLESPSHAIEVDTPSVDHKRIALAQGKVVDDRDFIMKYRLAGVRTAAGFVAHRDGRGEFFSMLIEPPKTAEEAMIEPRELVFVLDASCSMSGEPIRASKRLVEKMLDRSRPADLIRIIHFGSDAHAFSAEPLPATPDVLARARRYLASIDGQGGTEVELGIKAALEPPVPSGHVRLVVFLTDGFIGNEASVMAVMHKYVGSSRTFAYGIGSGVNRWLLEEMAIAGRGVARIVSLEESDKSADQIADDLATRLQSPIMSNLSIDWGDLDVAEAAPSPLPDLFAGAPIRVLGRIRATKRIAADRAKAPELVGTVRGKTLRVPIAIDRGLRARSEDGPAGGAIPVLWAHGQIADRVRAMTKPFSMRSDAEDASDADLVEQITALGLEYAITTRWTAFVAVAERKVDAHKPAAFADVPTHEVNGAFGQSTQPLQGSSPFGSSPEPETWAAMLVLAAMALIMLRRRRLC